MTLLATCILAWETPKSIREFFLCPTQYFFKVASTVTHWKKEIFHRKQHKKVSVTKHSSTTNTKRKIWETYQSIFKSTVKLLFFRFNSATEISQSYRGWNSSFICFDKEKSWRESSIHTKSLFIKAVHIYGLS